MSDEPATPPEDSPSESPVQLASQLATANARLKSTQASLTKAQADVASNKAPTGEYVLAPPPNISSDDFAKRVGEHPQLKALMAEGKTNGITQNAMGFFVKQVMSQDEKTRAERTAAEIKAWGEGDKRERILENRKAFEKHFEMSDNALAALSPDDQKKLLQNHIDSPFEGVGADAPPSSEGAPSGERSLGGLSFLDLRNKLDANTSKIHDIKRVAMHERREPDAAALKKLNDVEKRIMSQMEKHRDHPKNK